MIRFAELWPLILLAAMLSFLLFRRELWGRALVDRLAVLLRVGALSLLLLALAGPQLKSSVDAHSVYFLVDRSASVAASVSEVELVERLNGWATPRPNTRYGLIVFGKQAFIEVPLTARFHLQGLHTPVDPGGTDLAGALELALATFPEGGSRTIVLLTDGRATEGGVTQAVARARREGVRVYALPPDPPSREYAIRDVRMPREVTPELPFQYQVVISASKPATGRLLVFRNGALISDGEVALGAGLNFVEQTERLPEPGMFEYRFRLHVPGDALAPNNGYGALVESTGSARVLLVEAAGTGRDPSPLAQALARAGFSYDRVPLERFAPSVAALAPFRAVIVNDVPLRALTSRQIERLERYLRDLGGGMWLVQGEEAVREFYDRTFERLLPVTYEGPEEIRKPALALVMLLDRSGSMGELAGRHQKIDLLKQAAVAAVERVDEPNLVGIVAFDADHEWLVPLDPVRGRKEEVLRAIDNLYPSGGTDLYPALKEATAQLAAVDARVKHLLVFSDGKVTREGRDFAGLLTRIERSPVSASSIAIGGQADIDLLWELAEVGGGVKYMVEDARDLPRITLEELVRLERARWIKGPVPVRPGPFWELAHLDAETLPPVDGYVLTFAKRAAKTVLEVGSTSPGDPLIGIWRYGLGQVAVLNTSFDREGLDRWLDWEGLGQLVGAVLGAVYSEGPLRPEGLTVRTELMGSTLTVTAEAERDGRWLNDLALEGRLSVPGGEARPLKFEQVGPGRYRSTAEDLEEGLYLLSVGGDPVGQVERALSVPYAPEYRKVSTDLEALLELAQGTGGAYLENLDDLPELLRGRTFAYRDIWQPVVIAALVLFIADLVTRKLPVGTGY